MNLARLSRAARLPRRALRCAPCLGPQTRSNAFGKGPQNAICAFWEPNPLHWGLRPPVEMTGARINRKPPPNADRSPFICQPDIPLHATWQGLCLARILANPHRTLTAPAAFKSCIPECRAGAFGWISGENGKFRYFSFVMELASVKMEADSLAATWHSRLHDAKVHKTVIKRLAARDWHAATVLSHLSSP